MKQRPASLPSTTIRSKTGCGNLYVTIAKLDDKPFEVFCHLGKCGGCIQSMTETIGRLLSWGLRSGASLEEAADQLSMIRCPTPFGDVNLSCADALSKVLQAEEKKAAHYEVTHGTDGNDVASLL